MFPDALINSFSYTFTFHLILLQDDNWAETTTVVTSECSASHDDLSRLEKADGEVSRWGADSRGLRSARRRLATAACITIAVATTLSPIAFVVLPQVVVITVLPVVF